MSNCIVRTGLCAFSTFFTFGSINVGTVTSRFNCTEFTGIDTCFSQTILTVFCHNIAGNGTVLTCRTDNLYYISIILNSRRFSFSQTNTLSDNLTFLVNATTELRERARNQLHCNIVLMLLKFPVKSQTCYFFQHFMFDLDYICVCVSQLLTLQKEFSQS